MCYLYDICLLHCYLQLQQRNPMSGQCRHCELDTVSLLIRVENHCHPKLLTIWAQCLLWCFHPQEFARQYSCTYLPENYYNNTEHVCTSKYVLCCCIFRCIICMYFYGAPKTKTKMIFDFDGKKGYDWYGLRPACSAYSNCWVRIVFRLLLELSAFQNKATMKYCSIHKKLDSTIGIQAVTR